ncbi:MAG TPA: S53 family peptidase [Streptosporangiaceae bacterium]
MTAPATPGQRAPGRARRYGRRVALGVAYLACVAAGLMWWPGGGPAAVTAPHHPAPHHPAAPRLALPRLPRCPARSAVPCYARDPLHRAYGTAALYARGITGAGTTIAVILPDAAATVLPDLGVFDRYFRLPRARVQVLSYDHARPDETALGSVAGWDQEGTADLELAHFMAPAARLAYVRIPAGKPQDAMGALAWLSARERVDVASFSWGTWEPAILSGGPGALARLRAGLVTAAARGVTVIAGSGDTGPTFATRRGWYPRRAVPWPTSDPLVTGTGETTVPAPGPDAAPPAEGRPYGTASGAGLSRLFGRPCWQDRVRDVTGSRRGVTDISMTGQAWVYVRTPGQPHSAGWNYAWGSSLSAPLLAGIIADAAQQAGRPLGVINPALYQMHGSADGITDVTRGNDSAHGVAGYSAGPGYDLPTGIGTISNAAAFTTALTRLDRPPAPGRAPGSCAPAGRRAVR